MFPIYQLQKSVIFDILKFGKLIKNHDVKMKKGKKGVSSIIATILLILISIFAATIIIGFVVPFVKDTLAEEKECYEVKDQLKINTESAYTCVYGGGKNASVTIRREFGEVEIKGFKMGVYGDDGARVFDIKEGRVENVKMINGSDILEIPEKGGERTYSINTTLTNINEVKIVPLRINGKPCSKAVNTAKIKGC